MSSKIKYLKIPIDKNKGNDEYYLKLVMDKVAKHNNYKNGKHYLSNKFKCSKTTIKRMTESVICPRAFMLDPQYFPSKDSYRYTRRIDVSIYGDVIQHIITEFKDIASVEERNEFIEYIHRWRLTPTCYQKVLCHKVIDGLTIVRIDTVTANRINKINDTLHHYDGLVNEIMNNIVEINL